ncbi:hypothetical protein P3386_24870, partial [Vibrio parahaemolyticus]|nr:hypothetical protein [Vibrio parahaemolyticus]
TAVFGIWVLVSLVSPGGWGLVSNEVSAAVICPLKIVRHTDRESRVCVSVCAAVVMAINDLPAPVADTDSSGEQLTKGCL